MSQAEFRSEQTSSAPAGSAPATGASAASFGALRRPSGVPDDWFVDPVLLGVPGVRQVDGNPYVDDNPLAWQTDSLCAQTDPEAFFPEKGGSTRDAKRICQTCEVKSQCLEYALQNDERFGIWGGLSERERRKLRKQAG
ncbi:WhiB family transcriptional regulator [Subtercola boreus]|uniref:WhiB family transcriptional regulator n=1 Tax=Subtercola boreus TaxID=120213 RepID=UPI000E2A2FE9